LSEPEQERDDLSSTSSSRLSTKPYVILHDNPSIQPSSTPQIDLLDMFSTPTNKIQKTLPDDSLLSNDVRTPDTIKQQTSVLHSSSPINNQPKSSSIKGKRRRRRKKRTHFTSICEQITYILFLVHCMFDKVN
jgi:hypothetical protein